MSQQILAEQSTVLQRFYERFDPHNGEETPELRRTREEYNRLAGRLCPPQKLSDPLDVLPPELVLQCFMALPRDRSDALDTLLTVSKRWRYFLESASSLWTRVFIEDMERGNRQARRSIELSRTSLLAVGIVLQPKLDLVGIFKGHAHRIKEITLRHRAYDMEFLSRDDLFLQAFSAISKLERLSSLESLTYTTTFQSPLTIDGDSLPNLPVIRDLVGFSVRSNSLGLNYQSLLQLSLDLALPDVHLLARQCPRLEHLRLTGRPANEPFNQDLSDFPLLKHLDFDRVHGLREMSLLLYARGANLATLQLRLRWSELLEAGYLGRLPNLIALKLRCVLDASPTLNRLILPTLPRIQEFHFTQIGDPSDDAMAPPRSSEWLRDLLRALMTRMQKMRVLKLSIVEEAPTDLLLEYLSQLVDLEQLEFSHNKLSIGSFGKRTTLPSIKSLRLPSEIFLRHVELPQLSHLWINSMASEKEFQSLVTVATKSDIATHNRRRSKSTVILELPSVKQLTWNGSATIGVLRKSSNFTTAFASISHLSFAEPYARKDANDFCEVILRHPSKCPHLKTIAFHCYPSWDLLFYMLLRRNIMPGMAISPIRSIELPGYPCTSLLSPLISLLSGRLCAIPALPDIALNIRSRVFDPSRPGCDCCLDCGLSCPLSVNAIKDLDAQIRDATVLDQDDDMEYESAYFTTTLQSDAALLPEPLKTWFDGWPQRRKAWNARSEESGMQFRRAFSCCKHDFDNLVAFVGSGG